MNDLLVILVLMLVFVACAASSIGKAREQELQGNGQFLPKVRLLGDSNSMGHTGYGPHVKAQLEKIANVTHNEIDDNCANTGHWIKTMDQWLGDTEWDVIYFNAGCHDQRFVDGKQTVNVYQYEINLFIIVSRLKAKLPNAKLVWATTCYIQPGTPMHMPGEHAQYREAALRVMEQHGVEVHDLLDAPKLQRNKDVHFTENGARALGLMVSAKLLEVLNGKLLK